MRDEMKLIERVAGTEFPGVVVKLAGDRVHVKYGDDEFDVYRGERSEASVLLEILSEMEDLTEHPFVRFGWTEWRDYERFCDYITAQMESGTPLTETQASWLKVLRDNAPNYLCFMGFRVTGDQRKRRIVFPSGNVDDYSSAFHCIATNRHGSLKPHYFGTASMYRGESRIIKVNFIKVGPNSLRLVGEGQDSRIIAVEPGVYRYKSVQAHPVFGNNEGIQYFRRVRSESIYGWV